LVTALTIGTYTTIDIEGARRSTGFGYGIALMLIGKGKKPDPDEPIHVME